jgi:hypothetical protein
MADPSSILAANLATLGRSDPALADRLLAIEPVALDWSASRAGPLTATLAGGGKPLALASRFDPIAEAAKLTEQVDLRKHACVVVLGFGLGYHAAELAGKMGEDCLLLIHEPDLALLRAALERIDHTAWLGQPWVVITDDSTDRAALLARTERMSVVLTQGTILVTHPPSRQLHGEKLQAFGKLVTEALAFCRTNVATSLVNATRTYRNLSNNIALYAAGATTDELCLAAHGYPAVCVSAGPSLAKNVHLLSDPAVRRNVIVITAQTTLKPLLDRGITPDFVTALDYHEISRRFYEGLPPLPDVTLVAEPKANPTIIESFPGPVRLTQSHYLDKLLGPLARRRVPVKDGATVAHLSFYLAQHLGCDPIILIGQDLGFSNGLYYCPGTAIHDVWAPELNGFNTLEMMEWQRIVRHRRHLQKIEDIHGGLIYSDEQMITYLKQFERDFTKATERVLDATEGGARKAGATVTTLEAALREHATRPAPAIPRPGPIGFERLAELEQLLCARIDDVHELDRIADDTIPILRQMIEQQRDAKKMSRLFDRLERNKKAVEKLESTFGLVNDLNTVGVFRRARADRAILHNDTNEADPAARQRRQLERDIDNINWLRQAYTEALSIFEAAMGRVANERGRRDVRRETATAGCAT